MLIRPFFLRLRQYRKLLFALLGILFMVGGTLVALRWARGYRPMLGKKGPVLTGTGLLVSTSDPKGAQVFLNGKLTTATDDTLNLPPGSYQVEIRKDGYITWKKTLQIASELVTQTNTKLYPSVPNLTPLTFTGASEPIPSPDGQKIVYKVSTASVDANNGIWVLEMSERNFTFARASEPRQIARSTSRNNFLEANLIWTPDSSQVLAYWEEKRAASSKSTKVAQADAKPQPFSSVTAAVLLATAGMNDEANLRDTTGQLPVLLAQWHQQLDLDEQERLKKLPQEMQEIATNSARAAFFSPDELKFLYVATQKRTIPENLIPDIPSESTQLEQRDLEVSSINVYDIKEDRNYKLGMSEQPVVGVDAIQAKAAVPKETAGEGVDFLPQPYWSGRLTGNTPLYSLISPPVSRSSPPPLPPVPVELLSPLLTQLRDRYSPIWHHPLQWFPTSAHLLKKNESSISIVELDGTNDATVYAGPFDQSFVYPWPNGSRVVILSSFNESSPTNLYALNLR